MCRNIYIDASTHNIRIGEFPADCVKNKGFGLVKNEGG